MTFTSTLKHQNTQRQKWLEKWKKHGPGRMNLLHDPLGHNVWVQIGLDGIQQFST